MDSSGEDEVDGGCIGKPQKISFHQQVDDLTGKDETSEYYKHTPPIHYTEVGSYHAVPRTPIKKDKKRYYKMTNKFRGHALIFNHFRFSKKLNLLDRNATDKDRDELEKTLFELGFKVDKFQDLRLFDILNHVKTISDLDFSNKDCVIVAILSHGDPNIVYAYDTYYDPEILWKMFNGSKNPTLKGKPILFFINACQGNKFDDGIPYQLMENQTTQINNNRDYEKDSNPIEVTPKNISRFRMPNQSDLLVMYSTAPGYYSWRQYGRGSWFIQELCSKLNKYKYTEHILTILTYVTQAVAIEYESRTDSPKDNMKKQVPCLFSQLTKLLQFVENKSKNDGCCVD